MGIQVAFSVESQLLQSQTTQTPVHAGCFSLSNCIMNQTLTWITGYLICRQMLMHMFAQRGVQTPQESLH